MDAPSSQRKIAAIVLTFVLLQFLDLASTLTFLKLGVEEANPLIVTLIRITGSSAVALIAAKLAALVLCAVCVRSAPRLRLLSRANLAYAVLFAWNIAAVSVKLSGVTQ